MADHPPETAIHHHRMALEIAMEIVADDLRLDAASRKVGIEKLAAYHASGTLAERHLACHEDPVWLAIHFHDVPEEKRPETSFRIGPLYEEVIADFFDGAVDPGKIMVGEPRIVQRQIGEFWLLTSPDVEGLYVANRDLDVATAAVPSAIEMLERMRARLAARNAVSGRHAEAQAVELP